MGMNSKGSWLGFSEAIPGLLSKEEIILVFKKILLVGNSCTGGYVVMFTF
jgi:hypothetical protein